MSYTAKDAMERIRMYLEKNKGVELGQKDIEVLQGHLNPLVTGKEPTQNVAREDVVNQDAAEKESSEDSKEAE